MKMKVKVLAAFLLLSITVFAGQEVKKLHIGDKAVLTGVKMLAVSGEMVSIDDARKENGVLIIFSCNTCPFVLRWEGRYAELKELADKNKIGMLVLNSNYQKRNDVESYQEMKAHAKEKKYNFYYVVDKDSRIANAFGGQTTPHAFLFDGDMKLAYKGAIDDNFKSASNVKKAYLKDAISDIGKGENVRLKETQPVGCSIKRKLH